MKSVYNIPMRVTYYARVSSESDEQLNSLGNQITYYEDLIKRNRNWTFVPGYIDEGLSGLSARKRENFNRMIEEAADRIFVTPQEDGSMRLEIKIFTGEACEKYLEKLKNTADSRSRTGHTFKIIHPPYVWSIRRIFILWTGTAAPKAPLV